MSHPAVDLLGAVVVGLGATLVMDLWNLLLKRAFGVASLDYRMLGRWILHMPEGRFRHATIAAAAPRALEGAVGWIAHYSIGAAFAVGLVVLTSGEWLARPTLLPALACGVVTVVFPYFLLQPALGFGVAASRTPNPALARLKSLMTHTVFGIGLYLAALALNQLMRAFS
jgi:hypothetical protein